MSSSVFADCYIPYGMGCLGYDIGSSKKFENCKEGDTIYLIIEHSDHKQPSEIVEAQVVKPFYKRNVEGTDCYFIKIKTDHIKKDICVNIGSACSGNCHDCDFITLKYYRQFPEDLKVSLATDRERGINHIIATYNNDNMASMNIIYAYEERVDDNNKSIESLSKLV